MAASKSSETDVHTAELLSFLQTIRKNRYQTKGDMHEDFNMGNGL
jgi:hypothetical protein